MKTSALSELTTDQLVKAYIDISTQQADALLGNEVRRYNKLFHKLKAVDTTLRERGPEARKALVPLLDYAYQKSPYFAAERAQVRLNAAQALLAIVPEQARATLEELASRGPGDQRLSAGMCLGYLEKGIFKPT